MCVGFRGLGVSGLGYGTGVYRFWGAFTNLAIHRATISDPSGLKLI